MHFIFLTKEVTAMAFRDQPLGELALTIPRASALFRKYDLDFCCGGKQTLLRAAERRQLDLETIEAELAILAESPTENDWRHAPLSEIIDHIINIDLLTKRLIICINGHIILTNKINMILKHGNNFFKIRITFCKSF